MRHDLRRRLRFFCFSEFGLDIDRHRIGKRCGSRVYGEEFFQYGTICISVVADFCQTSLLTSGTLTENVDNAIVVSLIKGMPFIYRN